MSAPDAPSLPRDAIYMIARHCLSDDQARLTCPVCRWWAAAELDNCAALRAHLDDHTPFDWLRALDRARAH